MTPRERVLIALRREGKPDRVPFEISWGAFTPSLMETYRRETGATTDPDEYFDFDTRSVNLNPTKKTGDFRRFFSDPLPPTAAFDEWGCGSVPGSLEHFVEIQVSSAPVDGDRRRRAGVPLARCYGRLPL